MSTPDTPNEGQKEKKSVNRTIGAMNGRWQGLFKLALVIVPVAITGWLAHATWATVCIFSLRPDVPRYTEAEAERDNLKLKQEVLEAIDKRLLPLDGKLDEVNGNQIKLMEQIRVGFGRGSE